MANTTNQGWAKPTIGGSEDTWGQTVNDAIDAIDTLVGGVTAAEVAKLDGLTATTAELNLLDGVTATASEINYVDGVTSNIQTQLNAKADDSTTISAGAGLSGGGSLSANRTISHSDTSSQSSVNNSGSTYVQGISVDTYGHITSISSSDVPSSITETTGSAPYFGCRAFVFIADGSNASTTWTGQNIASVVRDSTGLYTVTFTTAMPNANYSVATGPNCQGSPNTGYAMAIAYTAKSASSFTVRTRRTTNHDVFDCDQMSFSIFA